MMHVKRPGSIIKRLVSAGIAVLMMGAIVFTKSRSGMLGARGDVPCLLLATRSLKPSVLIALVVGSLLVVPVMPQSFWDRMAEHHRRREGRDRLARGTPSADGAGD